MTPEQHERALKVAREIINRRKRAIRAVGVVLDMRGRPSEEPLQNLVNLGVGRLRLPPLSLRL
jgi:hypothetical protein